MISDVALPSLQLQYGHLIEGFMWHIPVVHSPAGKKLLVAEAMNSGPPITR